MNKILCPIDFSEASLNALEYAARIGEQHHADLVLLYVFTEEEHSALLNKNEDNSFEAWKKRVEEKLEGLANEVKATSMKKGLISCHYLLKQGNLVNTIKETTEALKANLIVMGTTGVSDVTEAYMGSNTVQTIQRTNCPVLCVPERAVYKKFKKVVYATDFQEEDKRAIMQLLAFVAPFDAHVDILHVSHNAKLFEKIVYEDFKRELKSYVSYDKLTFSMKVYEDKVNLGIDSYMIAQDAELLVLLTKERNFFEKLFTSSLSQRMSYFVDYPLLIYKINDQGKR